MKPGQHNRTWYVNEISGGTSPKSWKREKMVVFRWRCDHSMGAQSRNAVLGSFLKSWEDTPSQYFLVSSLTKTHQLLGFSQGFPMCFFREKFSLSTRCHHWRNLGGSERLAGRKMANSGGVWQKIEICEKGQGFWGKLIDKRCIKLDKLVSS